MKFADFEKSQKFNAKSNSRTTTKSNLTIVCSSKCKRIEISKELHNYFDNYDKIGFSFDDKSSVLYVFADDEGIPVKTAKNKAVIYNAALVAEIIERFSLDFEERTSISFERYDVLEDDERVVYFIMND